MRSGIQEDVDKLTADEVAELQRMELDFCGEGPGVSTQITACVIMF